MFEALNRVLESIQFGPHERRVKIYLEETTTDSVHRDLHTKLASRLSEVKGLWTLFDTYCVRDSTQERYWTEDSFGKYLKATHPEVVLSRTQLHLLWRSFHFFAYHPFPNDDADGKIDPNAFQRAVALLALRGTELLGSQEDGDYFWRDDAAFFHEANIKRIFRSIGTSQGPDKPGHDSATVLDDVMDVLATIQPFSIHLAPAPHQLESAASKLIGENSTPLQFRVTREDLCTLLTLMLRLRLHEATWGLCFHFGSFSKPDPGDEQLANAIARALCDAHVDLTPENIPRVLAVLPNLPRRFCQLWAVVFAPETSGQMSAPTLESVPGRVVAAVSLCPPLQSPAEDDCQAMTVADVRKTLRLSGETTSVPGDLAVIHVVENLVRAAKYRDGRTQGAG